MCSLFRKVLCMLTLLKPRVVEIFTVGAIYLESTEGALGRPSDLQRSSLLLASMVCNSMFRAYFFGSFTVLFLRRPISKCKYHYCWDP